MGERPCAGTVATAEKSQDVTLEEAQAVLATLALLPTVRERGASALSDLLYRRGLERAGEALNAWGSHPMPSPSV